MKMKKIGISARERERLVTYAFESCLTFGCTWTVAGTPVAEAEACCFVPVVVEIWIAICASSVQKVVTEKVVTERLQDLTNWGHGMS